MKLGRPVVAMPVGDFPALFAKARCGFLAGQATAAGLGIALREALATAPGSFDAGVRQHAADFDLPLIADRLLKETFANE
jgi:hypothetical protein